MGKLRRNSAEVYLPLSSKEFFLSTDKTVNLKSVIETFLG